MLPEKIKLDPNEMNALVKEYLEDECFISPIEYHFSVNSGKIRVNATFNIEDIKDSLKFYLEEKYGISIRQYSFTVCSDGIKVNDIEWDLPEDIDIFIEDLGIANIKQARALHESGKLYGMVKRYLDENEAPLDDLKAEYFEYEFDEDYILVSNIRWSDCFVK